MKRTTAAFLIAFLFHLLVIVLFWMAAYLLSQYRPAETQETEQRIKVSLKEYPAATQEALVKNRQQVPQRELPMPKGKQLTSLVDKPFETYRPEKPILPRQPPLNPPETQEQPEQASPTKTRPLPPKEEHITLDKERLETPKPTTVPSEHEKLYSLLSQPAQTAEETTEESHNTERSTSRINQDFKELYGDEFGKLSEGEQKYLLDNQEIMRRITQEVLNRVGRVNIPRDFRVTDFNVVEFYLYPNGDISDIRFIRRSGFYLLDDTTKETVEYAYSKYPRPQQKTLIRYRVGYYLDGY